MRPTASPRLCRCGCAGELPLGVGESRRSAREAGGRCGAVAGLGGFQASGSWSQDRKSRSRTKAQKSMEVNGPGQDTGLSAGLGLLHSTHLGTAHRHAPPQVACMRCCVATTGQLIVSCAPCATATRQHPGEACTIGYERELQYHSHRNRGPKTNGRTWP